MTDLKTTIEALKKRDYETADNNTYIMREELRKELRITDDLIVSTDCSPVEKHYWRGYRQGLKRTLEGRVPTQIKDILSEGFMACLRQSQIDKKNGKTRKYEDIAKELGLGKETL